LQIITKFVSNHTADSKPDKQEVNGAVILPPLEFPVLSFSFGASKAWSTAWDPKKNVLQTASGQQILKFL
jgi:hypothetical protein